MMSKNQSNPEPPAKVSEGKEFEISIATGPLPQGMELCLCSIQEGKFQIYHKYFKIKKKMKGGTLVLKDMGLLKDLKE